MRKREIESFVKIPFNLKEWKFKKIIKDRMKDGYVMAGDYHYFRRGYPYYGFILMIKYVGEKNDYREFMRCKDAKEDERGFDLS